METVLVFVTMAGTFAAFGGVVAAARGASAWSPPEAAGRDAANRVRRLVAVTRLGGGPSDGSVGAPGVATTEDALSDWQPAETDGRDEASSVTVGRSPRSADAETGDDKTAPIPIRPPDRIGMAQPMAQPIEDTGTVPRDEVARLAERQDEAVARLAEQQAKAVERLAEQQSAALERLTEQQADVLIDLARIREEQAEALAGLTGEVGRRDAGLAERLDGVVREAVAGREAERSWRGTAEARLELALERLRTELLAGWSAREAAIAERDARLARVRVGERQGPAAAELYARLARLEAALAAVTNPMLLPGEPYAPPTEFSDDALAWENWKDVGERAFAFADHFNTQRLVLESPTQDEVATFVTDLRVSLTRSVYPNLRPDATPDQLEALRAALERLATDVPRVRAALASEYRTAVDGQPPA